MDTYRGEAHDIAEILISALTPFADHVSPIDDTDCPEPLVYSADGIARCETCGFYSDPFEGLGV